MPCRILIADDHAGVRKTLTRAFQMHPGWEVCGEAATGLEAVEKATALKPDIIVLDLSMPVMDGLQAASQILSTDPNLPIILFTNHLSATLDAEARKAGIRRVLSKDGTELLNTIEAVLNEKLRSALDTIQAPSPQKTKLPADSGNK
jgi:DNA-binding NarL/FixJ family response regulator